MFHHWIALIVLALFTLTGFSLTLVGIGGTFLIVIGALLYNLIVWSWTITPMTVLVLAGLAALGEVLEWIISVYVLKKSGASHYSVVGMIVGAIIGGALLSIIPIIGTLIGIILGAVIGTFVVEYLNTGKKSHAWKAAKGTIKGRMYVIACKATLAIVQTGILFYSLTG